MEKEKDISVREVVDAHPFTCAFNDCLKSYSCLADLKKHEETHGGNYRCTDEKCGMKFKSKCTLKKHADNIHLKKEPKKYKCQDCGEEFNKQRWLMKHQYKHTGVKPYVCSVEGCDARFLDPSNLNRHKKVHAADEHPFICTFDDCLKSYSCLSHLKRHELTHEGNYRCTDEKCGMKFKSKYYLKIHIDNIHLKKKPKKYKCEDCEEEFNKHSWLTRHRYKHTGVKPYACSVEGCDARFLVPSVLKKHMKVHAGYTCPKENCGEHFSKWSLYYKHLSSSHPPVFKCGVCEKEFLRSNNLKAHLQIHQSDREVFFCPMPKCSRFYTMERNLTYHIKSYHDKRPFVCTEKICSKAFKTQEDLDAHLQQHDLSRQKHKKKKKTKTKPSLAAELAGLAPKKWQITGDVSTTSNEVEADKLDPKLKENLEAHSINTKENQETIELPVESEKAAEKKYIEACQDESDESHCDTSNDIKMLINMIEERTQFGIKSAI